ncbi:DNA-formamidopyrimidine glycosylase family protein, partial [Arthrobacter sp. H14]|uniref:DNA-formamidopyrimidine glycosylase family protein n=1 Tax=Arthrobacter sp. H14 TaxID=1312959 RepID=UPI000567E698
MPEGDTVWAAAHRLNAALAGQKLTRTDFRVPRYATVDLSGRTVTEVLARGKHLLIRLGDAPDDGNAAAEGRSMGAATGLVTIHSHLKMEGSWHVYRSGGKWRRPAFTARAVLATGTVTAVGYSLGTLQVLARSEEDRAVGHLGPDLLGPDWDAEEAVRRLRTDPARAIGLALLDQRNLAGIGNVYRSEICFLTGVHPDVAVAEVPRLERMVETSQRLLQANRNRSIRITTGFAAARGAEGLWVYGRAG